MKKLLAFLLVFALVLPSVVMPVFAEEAFYVAPASEITDIEGHWANQSIWALVNRGILSGYTDKTFKPNNQITRGEYLTALFKTVCVLDKSIIAEDMPAVFGEFNYYGFREHERSEFLQSFEQAQYEPPYKDLENHWSKNYVAWVKEFSEQNDSGLFTKVFSGENFFPNQPITREEAVLVTIAFTAPSVRSRGINFKDIGKDYTFYNEIMSLVDNEIINGFPDGTFKPQEKVTRAETAVIMTNVLKEIAYNMDFFADSDTYLSMIGSTSDADYIATFMTEEMFQNPPSELDKKYAAEFKVYQLERQMLQELMGVDMYAEQEGFEYGTEAYYHKVEELEKAIAEKYEDLKREEIPYYEPDQSHLEVLQELESAGYWNKAGLYYWMYRYDQNRPFEYLEKAEKYYDIAKNGKGDLFKLYEEFINYYLSEDDSAKVVEYIDKAEALFVPNEYGEAYVANMDQVRFYPYAAFNLVKVGEYSKALAYINKLYDETKDTGGAFGEYFALERGALMYLCGDEEEAIQLLKENLAVVENEEYVNQSLKEKYIWALKSILETN